MGLSLSQHHYYPSSLAACEYETVRVNPRLQESVMGTSRPIFLASSNTKGAQLVGLRRSSN